ncbi:glucokinase [Sorangium sp. So ce861]|uniref:glucokinase n=1 Tax=Sorangium sp. So ce861 TaxID=3133323 RepID=UPI003F63B860
MTVRLAADAGRWQGARVARTKKSVAPSLLVGDIGGTNTRLALYDASGDTPLSEAVFRSREHASFEEIALPFLVRSDAPHPAVAVLGVAGPIKDHVATITNLPWRLAERELSRRLKIARVQLANDLVVGARGCLHIPRSSIAPLTERRPRPKESNLAVIAAGTGLGEARLVWDGARHLTLPTEGGHADFAPRSAVEVELWQFLAERHPDHVSYERVLSGDGLGALFDFFAARAARVPRAIERRLAEGDRNAAIAELGLARAFRPAARAVDLFVEIYGAEAGNLALRELALGGVFVLGNIARNLVTARRELFMKSFLKKGRLTPLLEGVPVAVVTDPLVGVRGALALARELAARGDADGAPRRRAPSRRS